ncbi:conserved hypothetical protein [Streptomyces sp. SPB78]|uniref:Uncharacterized protein n=1 Tax=Streptomyces phage SF3 TaxID=1690818 RepID=A0A0M4RBC4_9CAUD|nr:hypothetical protein [Streptomyces sp. SPB78]YP_009213174.1 hypothetical protein AVV12_gp47 [Streptomyces phage SF3]ALF00178.1 hypothetical protein SF3_470 [Streptomyces phage SF3]EFL00619.1 conserved hypothetical protein [Streptomyces sp. SPB78]
MTRLDDTRRAAHESLKLMCGDAWPEWRAAYTTDGTDGPTGIAPVCPDPEHERGDGDLWACCPEPAVEAESNALAGYLVALLNADRPGGAA